MKTCKELNSFGGCILDFRLSALLTSNHACFNNFYLFQKSDRVKIKHVGDGAVSRCTKHTTKCQIEPFQLLIAPGAS